METAIKPKLVKTTRSLIPHKRLKVLSAKVDMSDLLVHVMDTETGREELLQIQKMEPFRYVPDAGSIDILIRKYIKYDLYSQEKFICLTEEGKRSYVQVMRKDFYPFTCSAWMTDLISYLYYNNEGSEEKIKSLQKSLKGWARKEWLIVNG